MAPHRGGDLFDQGFLESSDGLQNLGKLRNKLRVFILRFCFQYGRRGKDSMLQRIEL
jgi:hypothetical protein